MELKDFISSTIEEISRGILTAGEQLKDTNAIVSPHDFKINSQSSQAFGRTINPNLVDHVEGGTRVVQKVDFDIAVTIDEADKTNAGAKISVLSIGIGAGVETASKTGSISRIQFSVPVVFPSNET
jgi:aromatic ring-opening dioxygenase LigB subunit